MTGAAPFIPPTIRQLLARGHLRLVLLSVVLAALGLTLSGVLLQLKYERQNVGLVGRSVAYAAEPAVFFGDMQGVGDALTTVRTIGSVESIDVLDAQGRSMARWRAQNGDQAVLRSLANSLVWPSPFVIPIVRDGRQIGVVRISGNADGLIGFALTGLFVAAICFGLSILAANMLARRLQKEIAEPLEYVAALAHAVRSERDFSRRVENSGIMELDRFGQDFNDLLQELQSWDRRMTSENQALAHQAEHDVLTGLGNRLRFERSLSDAIATAEAANASFTVLYIDLNRFKEVNDRFGHHAGDLVLEEFASRLRASVRGGAQSDDQIFRLGGDEFAIILAAGAARLGPDQVIARIEAAMLPPVVLDGEHRRNISFSIGASAYPDDGTTAAQLLRRADDKMYRQKKGMTGDA